MRFIRLGLRGAEFPAVAVDDEHVFDLRPLTADLDGSFLATDGIGTTRAALMAGSLPPVEQAVDWTGSGVGLRLGAPIARPPAVVCIGRNYAAHAAESGNEPPPAPVVFFKHPNTVVGPHDDVLLPPGSERTDWEVELGVVIGRRARYLTSVDEALDHVAGYVVSDDVSERDFQIEQSGGQWSKGKCAETFNPLGPALIPAEEVDDPQRLGLRSFVNGAPRQDSNTEHMLFGVAFLIHHLSQYLVLEPGDLLNTGTPDGVALGGKFPYLADGDELTMEIDGLGGHRSHVRAHVEPLT